MILQNKLSDSRSQKLAIREQGQIDNEEEDHHFMIFLACVPGNASVEDLTKLFSQYGGVKNIGLKIRASDKKCAGFGYLTCEDQESYDIIIGLKSVLYLDRKMIIKKYIPNTGIIEEKSDVHLRRISVKNISIFITDDEFLDHFSKFGKVEVGYIVR